MIEKNPPQTGESESVVREFLPAARRFAWLALSLAVLGLSASTVNANPSPPPDFTDAPIYEIGEIPFQTVWHGKEIKFRVRAAALGSGTPVLAGYVNPPSGAIYYESGNFFYRPGDADKSEFTVTFSAAVGPQRVEQIVPIQPIPLLPPEHDYLGVERKGAPDPASRDYIVINDKRDTAASTFNHISRHARNVTIAGKEIVFRRGHASRLFETFQTNGDIRQLIIHAEKVTIGSTLRLPSSAVTIRARELEFQDVAGETASISTEPDPYPNGAASYSSGLPRKGADGANGLPGGNITIYVQSVKFGNTATPVPRFILNGGRGQNPGRGRNGAANGVSLTRINPQELGSLSATIKDRTTALVDEDWIPRIISFFDDYYQRVYFGPWRLEKTFVSTASSSVSAKAFLESREGNTWRLGGNGEDAVPDGIPGDGGRTGILTVNFDPALALRWSQRVGGNPGTARSYTGGAPRSPAIAYAYFRNYAGAYTRISTDTTVAGADAPAATASRGAIRAPVQGGNEFSWFTSSALRQIVNFAKDAYLAGQTELCSAIVSDYLGILEKHRVSAAWSDVSENGKRDHQQLEEEMRLMSFRIANNLDYFGNPPGWVPLLSLEASKLALEQEIDRSMGILYVEYWLTNTAYTLQAKLGALADARQNLGSASARLAREYESASTRLPILRTAVLSIQNEVGDMQWHLRNLEEQLLRRAEAKAKGPWWKRVARGLATICKAVPVPIVQAVGEGLDVIAKFDPQAPWDTILQVRGVINTYQNGGFDQEAEKLNEFYKGIDFPELPKSLGGINPFADKIQIQSSNVVSKLKDLQRDFQQSQAPRSQIDIELAKLKSESTEFKHLTDKISNLMDKKESLGQEIVETIQRLTHISGQISGNMLAMDALNEGYAQAAGALDDRAIIYIREIGRRARERLLLYHYYVKKSYEYRLLKPYPNELNLQRLFDRVRTMAEANGGTYKQLDSDQFRDLRGIYDDALGELVREVLAEYSGNGWPQADRTSVALSREQVASLSSGQTVTLDLTEIGELPVFPVNQENIRIMNVRVLSLLADPLPNSSAQESMEISITHDGMATMTTSAGGIPRTYRFQHYSRSTELPVRWSGRYRPSSQSVTEIPRSPSADSLISALLHHTKSDPGKAGYFTHLGGLATLTVERHLNTQNQRSIRLQHLELEIEYEFTPRRDTMRLLDFVTSDGLAPYIELSKRDLSGRKDAFGSLKRMYHAGERITLSVPDRIGNLRFAGFFESGTGNQGDLQAVALSNPKPGSITALSSAVDGKVHRLVVDMSIDRRVQAIYEPLPPLQLSIQRRPRDFLLQVDGERFTPFLIEQAADIGGPWLPWHQGTIIDSAEIPLPGSSATPRHFYRATSQ